MKVPKHSYLHLRTAVLSTEVNDIFNFTQNYASEKNDKD
jgi:hypothetical protein